MATSKKKQQEQATPTGQLPSLRKTIGSVRTVAEWRGDPNAVTWLAAELAKPQWQEVLQILDDCSPSRVNSGVVDADTAAQLYNAEQGYRSYAVNLRTLAEWAGYDNAVEEVFKDN